MKLVFGALVVVNVSVGISAFFVQSSHFRLQSVSSLNAVVNVDGDAERDIAAMEEWASACGVQRADGLQLVAETIDGFLDVSASTTQDLPANSPVVFVPNEMILSSNKAVEEFGRIPEAEELIFKNGVGSELRHYYLMLKILAEWERGEDSPWFPYLNSLPRWFCTGASMTPFCYKCTPPLLAALVKQERSRFNKLFVKRVPFLSNDTKGKMDLWKWAFNIVYTRSFDATDGSGDLRIAPMADMFNHGTETEVEYSYDEAGNCYVQTTRDVPAGSPLRMSYANPANPSFLLARYGFLDETSPATFCKILPPRINKEMLDLGYAYDRMLFYKDSGDVSPEVWDILLYQVLTETDKGTRQEFYAAHMNGDYATKQRIHEQYYPATSGKLFEHIDSLLAELDGLSAKAVGRDFETNPRLPLILRHNEFVKKNFLAVRSRYFE
eukprot:scaffold22742_cov139-Cylindrotheca_fusiformis.AAC.13